MAKPLYVVVENTLTFKVDSPEDFLDDYGDQLYRVASLPVLLSLLKKAEGQYVAGVDSNIINPPNVVTFSKPGYGKTTSTDYKSPTLAALKASYADKFAGKSVTFFQNGGSNYGARRVVKVDSYDGVYLSGTGYQAQPTSIG